MKWYVFHGAGRLLDVPEQAGDGSVSRPFPSEEKAPEFAIECRP
jgi:hypothetical protein